MHSILVPTKSEFVELYINSYAFEQLFVDMLRTSVKVSPQKISSKFDFYVQIFVTFILNFCHLKNSYLIHLMLKNSKF